MFKSIKAKLIVTTLTIVILSVGIPVYFLLNQFQINFNERSEIMLNATMNMLRYGLDNSMMEGSDKNVQDIIDEISSLKSIDHIRIFNRNGEILYATNKNEIRKKISRVAPDHIKNFDPNNLERKIRLLNNFHAFSAVDVIKNEDRCSNCHENKVIAYLDVDSHLTDAERKFYIGSIHTIFLAIFIIVLITILFIYIFNKLVDKPLKRFLWAFNEVENGNLTVKLTPLYNDEIGVLKNHFNGMINKLISSRKKIEELHFEQLQHAHKLAMVGELTTEMAHEINNHTGILLTRSDYLQLESMRNENLKEFKDDFNVIQNQSLLLSKITSNILKHSKKSKKELTQINLCNLIANSIQIFNPILDKKNIKIEKEIKCENKFIEGEEYQLEQIITNLINNAIDAIGEKGNISISLDAIEEKAVELKITDDGNGIDKENLDKLFLPFFSTKGKEKGTGLGLYIVKKICENHNAEIFCESEIEKGTTFTIRFNL